MRPHFPYSPPDKERDRQEGELLTGLDLSGTQDEKLLRDIASYKERFDSSRFCVYEHRIKSSFTPFYVGMGQEGDRAFRTTSHRNHNRQWCKIVARHGRPEVVIIKAGLTRQEAEREEQRLIEQYRKQSVNLVNIHRGGEIPTYRTAWKISRSLRLHAACQQVKRITEATLTRFAGIQQEFAL